MSCYVIIQNFKPLKDRYSFSRVIEDYSIYKNNPNFIKNNITKKNRDKAFIDVIKFKYSQLSDSLWFSHYRGAIIIFKNSPFFGSGFKTYRSECPKIKNIEESKVICTTHPHNIYFEILSDLGIIGLLFLLLAITIILRTYIINKFYKNFSINILLFATLSFLFPFKPHGSFFSTNYAFMFWYLITFLIIEMHFVKKKLLK